MIIKTRKQANEEMYSILYTICRYIIKYFECYFARSHFNWTLNFTLRSLSSKTKKKKKKNANYFDFFLKIFSFSTLIFIAASLLLYQVYLAKRKKLHCWILKLTEQKYSKSFTHV